MHRRRSSWHSTSLWLALITLVVFTSRLGVAQVCVQPTPFVPVGDGLVGLVAGDWNEDGHSDFATGDHWKNRVHLVFGDGFGGFFATSGFDLPYQPLQIEAGDFDSDAHRDLLLFLNDPSSDDRFLQVWKGTGLGTFVLDIELPLPGVNRVLVVDYNGDGLDDFLSFHSATAVVGMHFAIPGGFTTPIQHVVSDGWWEGVEAADLDHDGNMDLIVAASGELYVYRGIGTGLFLETTLDLPEQMYSPLVCDVNGDGHLDILSRSGSYYEELHVHFGNGAFDFVTETVFVPDGVSHFETGDFNGDGRLDVFVARGYPKETCEVWLGSDAGLVPPGQVYAAEAAEWTLVGDWNGDGLLDVAGAARRHGHLAILTGDGSGDLTIPDPHFPTVGRVRDFQVGDFDNDGHFDLVTVRWFDGQFSVYRGHGGDDFQLTSTTYSDGASRVEVADLDADGDLDLLILRAEWAVHAHGFDSYLGDGLGGFDWADSEEFDVGLSTDVEIVDFTGDGVLDVLVVDEALRGFVGLGNGAFSALPPQPAPGARLLATADFDSDGFVDVAVGGGADVSVYLGTGTGAFTLTSSFSAAGYLPFLETGDFNGDGAIDLLVCPPSAYHFFVAYGDGQGGFSPGSSFDVSDLVPVPRLVQSVRDVTGDGLPDFFLVAVDALHVIETLPGDRFRPISTLHIAESLVRRIVDLDGDGLLDLVTLSHRVDPSRIRFQYGIPCFPAFVRGDVNADQAFDITDAVATLELLVGLGAVDCEAAADSNDDGLIDVADAVYSLNHLFVGGPPPGAPFVDCGPDPTPSGLPCGAPCP